MRNLVVGTPMSQGALAALVQLALFAAVMLPISLWALAKSVDVSRRRGTIIEY